MNPNRYTTPGLPMIDNNTNGKYVLYDDYAKLHKMYQSQHELLSSTNEELHDYKNLMVEMLDYYKIGGYNLGLSYPSVKFGDMLRDAIDAYIDSELENCNSVIDDDILLESIEGQISYDDLKSEVEHLRAYTDHLVDFSKLPCLPKDLENLREANLKLATENQELKDKLKIFEYNPHGDFIREEFQKHVYAASIFQCGGKYHKRANLKLGASTVTNGIDWADKEIERLDNEIIGWENKWNAAVQMAAEAENKLEAIRAYVSED